MRLILEIWQYLHEKLWNVITDACPDFNESLPKPTLKLRHGWLITSHRKLWDVITYPCPWYLFVAHTFSLLAPHVYCVTASVCIGCIVAESNAVSSLNLLPLMIVFFSPPLSNLNVSTLGKYCCGLCNRYCNQGSRWDCYQIVKGLLSDCFLIDSKVNLGRLWPSGADTFLMWYYTEGNQYRCFSFSLRKKINCFGFVFHLIDLVMHIVGFCTRLQYLHC